MNETLAVHAVEAFIQSGGRDFCVCPGSRNAPLVTLISSNSLLNAYYFYEERSASFFALGLSQRVQRPVAIVTTSGTAAGELLPAMMEAYYTGIPIVAITADRPKSYRRTNAPQTCEQVGLFGHYAVWSADLEGAERLNLSTWDRTGPAHVNICFNEPLKCDFSTHLLKTENIGIPASISSPSFNSSMSLLDRFLKTSKAPLVIVGTLLRQERDCVRRFLRQLNAPVCLEATSGLREDLSLMHLRILQTSGLWRVATESGYPIDGVLRIGGVPTVRLWRDLEDMEGKVQVCSVSSRPFSGLSWGQISHADLSVVFDDYQTPIHVRKNFSDWKLRDNEYYRKLQNLYHCLPDSEPALIHALSKQIEENATVYLGNSMPIRNWDLAAAYKDKGLNVWATRGLSGIDGQVSTFFGLCQKETSNWALLGDLTVLYDMSGFWITRALAGKSFSLVIINNAGGQIFSRMYSEPEFTNAHSLRFKSLAEFWGLDFERWEGIPERTFHLGKRIVELIPNNESTAKFWNCLKEL